MRGYLYRLMTDQARGFMHWPAKLLLKGISFLYGWGAGAIAAGYERGAFKRYELGRPVISVGNITLGGVGKTPLVLCLAEYILKKNIHPVILARGYAADLSGKNDEAVMVQAVLPQVPVVINKDRVKGAQEAMLHHRLDIFLLDDGFQQWRVNKDIEIVAIDATDPFGNGSLLPRGILREPVESLGRADLFVITKTDLGQDNLARIRETLMNVNPKAPVVEAVHKPVAVESIQYRQILDLDWLKGQDAGLLCSIGNPDSFAKTVAGLGARVKKQFIFPDHHHYTTGDIQKIRQHCHEENIKILLTTAKDESKLKDFPELWTPDQGKTLQVYILKINLVLVKGQDEFFKRIDRLLLR